MFPLARKPQRHHARWGRRSMRNEDTFQALLDAYTERGYQTLPPEDRRAVAGVSIGTQPCAPERWGFGRGFGPEMMIMEAKRDET